MSTAELKLDLINKITKLTEVRIMEEIQKLLDFEADKNATIQKDWWDEISDAEKKSIEIGIEQADAGKLNPHSQAREIYVKTI